MTSASQRCYQQCLVGAAIFTILFAIGSSEALGQRDPVYDKTEVKEFRLTFHQQNWWQDLTRSGSTGIDVEADLEFEGVAYPSVGIRIKGNTSAGVSSPKKPFNLSLGSFVPDQRLHGYKTINFNNAFLDPTFTREILTYDFFEQYLPTLQTGYAKLYFNDEYWGLYVLVEQPNKEFVSRHYADEDGVRYKGDDPNRIRLNSSTLQWFGSDPASYFNKYTLKTENHPQAWTSLVHLIDKLNNTQPRDFVTEIERVLDVDRSLWYVALSNVIHNLDSYLGGGHNYYMYFDPWDGRMDMITWDCNMSFGIFSGGSGAWSLTPDYRKNSVSRPLFKNLYALPSYKSEYEAHIRTALKNTYDWVDFFGPRNDQYQALIRSDVQADSKKLYSMAAFDDGITQNLTLDGWSVPGMRPLVEMRREYLLGHERIGLESPIIQEVTFDPSPRIVGQDLLVSAHVQWPFRPDQADGSPNSLRRVSLEVATIGSYKSYRMNDEGVGGDSQPDDGRYAVTLPIETVGSTLKFFVRAEDEREVVALEPPGAEVVVFEVPILHGPPLGDIALNELLAANQNGDRDEAGENDDWAEIVNGSNTDIDLSGHFLTDNFLEPYKWEFPLGTIIPANGFIRVWCDDDVTQGPLHANFKLKAEGEELALIAPDRSVLDAVVFGALGDDRGFARVSDLDPHWYHTWETSGESSNLDGNHPTVAFDRRASGGAGFNVQSTGELQSGRTATFALSGGPSNRPVYLGISLASGFQDIASIGPLSIDTSTMFLIPLMLDGSGQASFSFVAPSGLGNTPLYLQAISDWTSRALAVWISP